MNRVFLVTQPNSSSGLPGYIRAGLERAGVGVEYVDAWNRRLRRLTTTVESFAFNRKDWWRRRAVRQFYSCRAWLENSRENGRILDRSYSASAGEKVLQIGGLYFPHPDYRQLEYHLFFTYTMRLALSDGVSPWVIPAEEVSHFLELEESLYCGARHIFVSAEFVKKNLVEEYGVDPQRISVVGMGVDPYFVENSVSKTSSECSWTVLFVGYTFDLKGGPDLVRAVRMAREAHPNLRLRIIGPNPVESLKAPGIEFLGQVADRRQLLNEYRSADVFAMPSRCDSFGFVFLEAMSQGLPCIASNINAMPEIVHHGTTGYTVDVGDYDAISSAIVRICSTSQLRNDLGNAGRKRVMTHYQWDAVAAKVLTGMYESAPQGGVVFSP